MKIPRLSPSMASTAAVLALVGLALTGGTAAWASPATPSDLAQAQGAPPDPAFSDLSPDHWAYQAVQSLIQNYGCLAGYPDGTFRGDQPVTRYEFAAGMNACLDAVAGEVEARRAANQAEIDQLIQSMQEFQNELDGLESEVGL